MSTDLHDLTGVYAGGALPADERCGVEEHLSGCPRCAREARALLETTALLGVAAAAPPPVHLRARVLAEVATTAQLPALLCVRRASRHNSHGRPSPMRRWPLQAAACLAALGIGITAYYGPPVAGPNTIEQVQAQPAPARTLTATTAAASASVTLDAATEQMTFTATGLRALKEGRTYQLWLLEAAGPRAAGTFTLSPSSEAIAVIPGPGRASTLLVTEEPAGGSARPTTQPVLALDLRQA